MAVVQKKAAHSFECAALGLLQLIPDIGRVNDLWARPLEPWLLVTASFRIYGEKLRWNQKTELAEREGFEPSVQV
jgi:hypothetical protein